jgi:hypothetical protein
MGSSKISKSISQDAAENGRESRNRDIWRRTNFLANVRYVGYDAGEPL